MKTHLIFDLDGTLFDYDYSAKQAMNAIYSKINKKYEMEQKKLEVAYSEILKEVEKHAFTDGKTSTEYRRERFEKLLLKF
ncbi:HAD hydrolase-like protein, partial [Candidatus Micrarchaeota archaeon]|nr:HAD hydrolase-like protein [Candidatus Micrarchaeota archaeon]